MLRGIFSYEHLRKLPRNLVNDPYKAPKATKFTKRALIKNRLSYGVCKEGISAIREKYSIY